MISRAIVMSYDNDHKLNSYFRECASHAIAFLETIPLEIKEVTDNHCNNAYFDMVVLPILSDENSMLIIYSHGSESSFLCNGTPFIESNIDCNNINNTIIYTNACSTGKVFGQAFSSSGGVFIGYEADILVSTDSCYRKYFIECDNWGLFCLFHEKIQLVELRQAVQDRFNHHIDNLYKHNFVISSLLQEAKDNFVVLGNNLSRVII